MIKIQCSLFLAALTTSLAAMPLAGYAQESCDLDDINTAISGVESEHDCSAKGSFISVDTIVNNIIELCSNKGSRCRPCFRSRGEAAKGLVHDLIAQRLMSSGNAAGLRQALADATRSTCVSTEPTPNPDATPTPVPTQHSEPTPTPHATPTPNSNELATRAVLEAIKNQCCSLSESAFGDCRAGIVTYGLAHGLQSNAAASISAARRNQLCAAH